MAAFHPPASAPREPSLAKIERRSVEDRAQLLFEAVRLDRIDARIADQRFGQLRLEREGGRGAAIIGDGAELAADKAARGRGEQKRRRHDRIGIDSGGLRRGEPGLDTRGRDEGDRSEALFGPADGEVKVGERRRAGVGQHQPRRGGGLGQSEAVVELDPVDRDLLARNGEHRPRRLRKAVIGMAPPLAAGPQPLAGRARIVGKDQQG